MEDKSRSKILKHPLLVALVSVLATGMVTTQCTPDPPPAQVILVDSKSQEIETLSVEEAGKRIDTLASEVAKIDSETESLRQELANSKSKVSRLESEKKGLIDQVIRSGAEPTGQTIPSVTLQNGLTVTLESSTKTGSVAAFDFKIHNPKKELRMKFSHGEIFYDGEKHRSKKGNFNGVRVGDISPVPSGFSSKGSSTFEIPAALRSIELLRVHFYSGDTGWFFAEFRNVELTGAR